MKTCAQCDRQKTESQYYRHRDGLRPECKTCTRKLKNPYQRAYARALQQLRRLHQEEFDNLFNEEFDWEWA